VSLLKKQAETITAWVTKQLLDRWGVALLTTLGLVALPFVKKARAFLIADYLLPGWSIVAAGWLMLSLLGYVAVPWLGRRRLRRSEPVPFESCGMRWRLTINFWITYRTFMAEDMLAAGTILGPLCPGCELDASDDLIHGKKTCGGCGHGLTPTVPIEAERVPGRISANNIDPLFPIRKAAYRQAQAMALKGQIRQL